MAEKRVIEEVDLAEFIRCPLRIDSIASPYTEAPELEVAKQTARWLTGCAFEDTLPKLAEVREQFEIRWKARYHDSDMTTGLYRRGLKALPRYCKRLHDLVTDFIVLHPSECYSLPFSKLIVKGEYCTLLRPRKRRDPVVLRLRLGCDSANEISHRGPDPVNMARWLHFRTFEASLPAVKVLNYAIDKEEVWTDCFNEATVRGYLNHASLSAAEKRTYPSPGPHCTSCRVPVCNLDAQQEFPLWTK